MAITLFFTKPLHEKKEKFIGKSNSRDSPRRGQRVEQNDVEARRIGFTVKIRKEKQSNH